MVHLPADIYLFRRLSGEVRLTPLLNSLADIIQGPLGNNS